MICEFRNKEEGKRKGQVIIANRCIKKGLSVGREGKYEEEGVVGV